MVKITFPDGSVREYEQGVTGLQIAESILAIMVNSEGHFCDILSALSTAW